MDNLGVFEGGNKQNNVVPKIEKPDNEARSKYRAKIAKGLNEIAEEENED